MSTAQIILDDGKFYIVLNGNYESTVAPGFLSRRCACGPTTSGGYECVGGFQKSTAGNTWKADIQAVHDDEADGDCEVLVKGVTRLDAITALWNARNRALFINQ